MSTIDNRMNMRQVLEYLEKKQKGKRMLRYMVEKEIVDIYCEQYFAQIRKRAFLLKKQGLSGKHIAIIGKNSYEWLVNLCAIFWTGSVAVLFDRELGSDMIEELAERVDLAAILYDGSTMETVQNANLSKMIQKLDMRESNDMWNGENENFSVVNQRAEDLACIFFTSGTTAQSKAVMMSEKGLTASVCSEINDRDYKALLAVLPFHHLSGFISVLNSLYHGAEVCLAKELKYFYRYLEYMKPDYVLVVPSMLQMLAQKLKKGGVNGSLLGWNLRMIHCGGATFNSELLQMLLERNITVLQGYGASEAGGIGFLWEMTLEHPDTIGKPPKEMEVKIVDQELYIRSESVMIGYYNDEKATKEVICDGWYATGDLCRQDKEGYLYLIGRKKNLIILSNGENISPEEIETKLQACKEIHEVMVGSENDLIIAEIFPEYPINSSEKERTEIEKRIEQAVEQYNNDSPIYKQVQKINFVQAPFAKTTAGKLIRCNKIGGDK